MKNKTLQIISFAIIAFSSQVAQAIIIDGAVTSGSGSFFKLAVPLSGSTPLNTVGDNNFNDSNLYGFNEDQNVAVGVGGLDPEIGPDLTAGTIVASHYIFFDPNGGQSQTGWVTFDANILAIFTSKVSLGLSDYLANTGVNYEEPTLRGLESGDVVSFTGKKLDVSWYAGNPGDYIRVLTAHSPGAVPDNGATAMLLGLGLGVLVLVRRRKS
ncbi:MAG: hypothetical protein ACI92G_000141 [Candidatus Pelagisphaera sp.]|jgi:hypothetical protein